MANKPFEIQSSTLTIGGVDLQAGTTGVVIPGVTQAVNYFVEEVERRITIGGNNPDIFGSDEGAVTVIDNAEYLYLVDDGDTPSANYVAATYSVDELDDGQIEEVNIESDGTFAAADKTRVEAADMWATTTPTPFVSFNTANWTQIPYRPKMRAGAIENVGGGSGGVVEREIEFPAGEEGDTAGTLALTPSGNLYICKTDWVDYSDAGGAYGGLETYQNFLPSQTGSVSNVATILLADVPSELLYILQNVTIVPSDWSVIMDDEEFGGEQTCTDVLFDVNGNIGFFWPYRDGTDPNGIPDGSGVTVAYSGEVPQPAIWEQVTTGNPLGDLTVEFDNAITNNDGSITLNANGDVTLISDDDILLESDDDIRITADDDIRIRTYTSNVNIITDYDGNDYTWDFDTTGDLTIPGNILKTTDLSITVGEPLENIEVHTVDEQVPPGGVWRLFIGDEAYPTLGTTVQIGDTVTTSWGTPITATITDIQQDNGYWQIHVAQDITAGHNDYDTVTFSSVSIKNWEFDASGNLTLPAGGDILDSNGNSVLGGGVNTNIWVQTFETASPATDVPSVAVGVEYDSDGNIIALFSHVNPVDDSTYYSVGKYTTTGTRIWTTGFADDFNTDGWGLAVDNEGGFIYIAGSTNADGGEDNATLTKIDGATGLVEWSKIYDFGFSSFSSVVDVTSDGDPVMVGYASNGDDRYVATTKVDQTDGSVIWSRALDGQNDEEAYGMAVGPSGEVVAVGYMESFGVLDAAETLSVDPVSDPQWTTSGSISADGVTADFTFTDGIPTFTNVVDTVGVRTVDDVIVTVLGSTIGGVNGVDDMIVKVATVAANDTDNRMLVVKYAANGTIAWQKAIQFDADFDCGGADADIDSEGNIYVCGQYSADNVDPIGQLMSIVKFNSSGVKQWSRRVVGNCGQWSSSIVVGADDHLYLSATTFSGTNPGDLDINLVLAKYGFDGTVEWQRLLDYTPGYSFGTTFFGSDIGGSNLAVKQDYVAVSLGFGSEEDLFGGPGLINAAVAQISATGDIFTVGNWDFKSASFSGVLNNTASDITVVDAGKTDYDNIANISTTAVTLEEDSSDFLIGTLYTAPGGDNSLINGAYTVTLENTGTLTLPAGGTITEGYVTSNPTIQLTPASPDVASQKLVIKGGGSFTYTDNGIEINYNNNTGIVGDTLTFTIYSTTYSGQTLYWWINPEGAGIGDTESGTVTITDNTGQINILIDSDDYEFTLRVSPEDHNYDPASLGVESGLINADAPTFDSEHHLHLTTGNLAETSIFLGTDDHHVRTTTAGNIEINTPGIVTVDGIVLQGTGYTNGSYTAQATTGGSGTGLTVDYLVNTNQVVTVTINQQGVGYNNGDVITIPGGSSSATVLLGVAANNVWAFGIDGTVTFPTLTVPLEDNANPVGTGQVLKFSDSTQQAIIFGPVSTATNTSAERVIIQGAPGYVGTAGEGGDVYVWAGPGGSTNGQGGDIKIRAGQGIGSGNGGYLNFQAGDSATGDGGWINIESGYSNTQGQGGDITIDARRGGEITLRTYNGSTSQDWLFGANGTTTLPGAVVKSTVAKTGVILPTTTGIPNALSGTMVGLGIADGTYGPFTKGGVTFSVTVAGGGISGFINISSTTPYAVNASPGTLTSEDLGDPPGQTTNINVISVVQETPTALDLTKSVNKLTDGSYTLANGVEGQIMYLVRQTGSTAHNVIVASARVDGAIETNISFTPFAPVQEVPTNMATLIFTDSAWQSMGGFWNFT